MARGTQAKQVKGLRSQMLLITAVVLGTLTGSQAVAARLDEMSLDRWKKLREVERYQLKIAEKYYGERKWKVALAEYEKYLTLYEDSEAAPYSQLKWSLCQRQLRKLNTAIKEGFQSVLDYWPESPEATASMYYIGQTYKNMGEIRRAKKAYKEVMVTYPDHLVTVYAINDLIAIATTLKDTKTRVELWKKLAFDIKRTRETASICRDASKNLASYHFYLVAFDDGVKALETTWKDQALTSQVVAHLHSPVGSYSGDVKQRAKGYKLADVGVAWVRRNVPAERTTVKQKAAARQHYYWVADLYETSRRDKQVETTYAEIQKAFGTDDDVLGRLAGFYRRKGRYDEARACYGRYQNKIGGNSGIAETYYAQKKIEPCVLAYRRNVALDTENPTQWHATIASTYRRVGQYDKAIAVYEQLLKVDVDNTQSWIWEIAICYRDWGKNKEAIGYFRQSTRFPGNYSEMAMCHRRLKQYKEAVILYNQIIGGAPSSAPWALLQIGYTRETAGQREQAIKTFQQVCKRFPKKGEASRAHAHLQNKYKISVTLGGAKKDN
ncbi:MAG: tetratricopeptide repeat protein [Planctomycetaceae bacterium]|nr:tetratricopeptide repeat protein [Planctomycetaceae bacterium]